VAWCSTLRRASSSGDGFGRSTFADIAASRTASRTEARAFVRVDRRARGRVPRRAAGSQARGVDRRLPGRNAGRTCGRCGAGVRREVPTDRRPPPEGRRGRRPDADGAGLPQATHAMLPARRRGALRSRRARRAPRARSTARGGRRRRGRAPRVGDARSCDAPTARCREAIEELLVAIGRAVHARAADVRYRLADDPRMRAEHGWLFIGKWNVERSIAWVMRPSDRWARLDDRNDRFEQVTLLA